MPLQLLLIQCNKRSILTQFGVIPMLNLVSPNNQIEHLGQLFGVFMDLKLQQRGNYLQDISKRAKPNYLLYSS